MIDYDNKLTNFMQKLGDTVSQHNADLIKTYTEKLRALPTEPGASRVLTMATRLKTVAKILDKPLDGLDEADIIRLNNTMRERGMESAGYYRRCLKQFLRLTDKKKFIDLLDSDYLRSPSTKNSKKMKVNPQDFWSEKQINDYITECKRISPMWETWAGLWLSTGCRPHELFGLKPENIKFEDGFLTVNITAGKTGARTIILDGNESAAVWKLTQPYLTTLKPGKLLFDIRYEGMDKMHKKICENIGIPKGEAQKFYCARKMALSRFYDRYGVVKGAKLAGHVPGSREMGVYVAMTDAQFKTGIAKITEKECPACGEMAAATLTSCAKCAAPLNRKAYTELIQKAQKEKGDMMMQLLEGKFEALEKKMEEKIKARA